MDLAGMSQGWLSSILGFECIGLVLIGWAWPNWQPYDLFIF